MNTFSFKKTWPAVALLGLAACQPELEAPSVDKGSADFSKYVAIGNSLTAGFQSGGLANFGIETSYPAILAQQFAKAGGGNFVQPTFAENQKDGSGYAKLLLVNGAATPVQPTAANQFLGQQLAVIGTLPASGQNQLAPYTGSQPDNLGIPGISVLSSVSSLTGGLAPYGLINPFYERLLTPAEKPTKDYVTFIGQKTPTFFTCWMGSNDVLTYATAGGVSSPTNPFSGLTDTTRFGIGYRAIMATITKNGTVKGVAANIPNVASIPYFNTVTPAAVLAQYQANNVPITAIFVQARTSATTSATAARAATATDLLTLTAQAFIAANRGAGTSPATAIPSQYVLDPIELTEVQNRTTQLNNIIAKTARKYSVGLVDMNSFFSSVALGGIAINATSNNASFVRGNLFSLDGVHPTSRGYAVIANEFIKVINATYSASIPQVNPNEYNAVLLP